MKRLLAACCLFWTLLAVAGPQPYFRHLGSRDGLAHPSVMSIAQDSLGRMWFGTENGISRYDGNRMVSWLGGSVISQIRCDSNGDVWFLADGNLFCSPGGNREPELRDPGTGQNPGTTHRLVDSKGNTWSGSRYNGLLRIDPDGHQRRYGIRDGLGSENVREIAEDSDGTIWVGTFRGLSRYLKEEDRFETFSRDDREGGLSNSSVFSVFVDRDGILWAGTYYGGVNYTDTRRDALRFYPASDGPGGLSHPIVGHLAGGRDGAVWICTEGGGVNRLDPSDGSIRRFGHQPFTNAKWLTEDPATGKVYIATNQQGLFALDPDSGGFTQLISPGDPDSPMSVINVVEQYGRDLILSTDDGVYLHRTESRRDSLLFPRTDGVRYAHIVIAGDRLWIASSRVVVFDLKRRTQVAEYALEGGVRPMRLLCTEEGIYATSFGHGLFKLDGDTFRSHGSLPDVNGYQIAALPNGGFLLSEDAGILVLNREGRPVKTLLRGKNLPLEALVMDSGLLVTPDGTVYAGGTNGLVSFHLDPTRDDEEDGLYFSELYADGNAIEAFSSTLRLKGPQNRLDLYFAPTHRVSEFNWADYEYRVKGLDRNWHETEGPVIAVQNLQTGSYVFQLRRRDADEVLCSQQIDIRPFWWASWWARAAYLLLSGGLILMLVRTVQIRRRAARQQELNETKMRFFTTASHELRTPLTLIIAQLDSILQSFRLPPRVVHKMKRATAQAREMNQLVSELIDFRKFEQHLVTLQTAPVSINTFLSDIYAKFQELAEEKGLHLSWEAAPGDLVVQADAYQLQKVLMNLVFNAIKFTPEGGRVDLLSDADVDQVRIQVRDSGIGMDKTQLAHIFERFYQGPRKDEVTRGLPGSGIGLFLAKEIVEQHGGSISVESAPGSGSVFTVTLPADSAPLHDGIPDGAAAEEIVIAEDNPEMVRLLRELFSVQYRVYTAPDGEAALRLIHQVHPALVVSDVMMPRMDGRQLCAAIKGDSRISGIPVVLLTALDDTESELSGLQTGADDYIAKPFDSRRLLTRCSNLIRARRAAPAEQHLSRKAVNLEDKEFLDKLTPLIEAHLSDGSLDNDRLAGEMNMSRSGFYARFRKVTGDSPADYINALRLQRACGLLTTQPGLSIADIAEQLGFNSQNYFCRRFRQRYGTSPSEYRKAASGSFDSQE